MGRYGRSGELGLHFAMDCINIFSSDEKVHLSTEEVLAIYRAKCEVSFCLPVEDYFLLYKCNIARATECVHL